MAGILSIFKKTLKASTNAVRRVGKVTRKTVRRGTNTLGLTRRRAHGRKH